MVNLNKVSSKQKSSKKAHPVLPFEDALLVDEVVELNKNLETIKGRLAVREDQLKEKAVEYFFTTYEGKQEVPSAVVVEGVMDKVMLTFQNKYSELNKEDPRVGELEKHLRQTFVIKIFGDLIPKESAQAVIDGLVELFDRHNCRDALEATEKMKVDSSFHSKRHLEYSAEQNLELHELLPCTVAVKKKGVS